MAKFFLVLTIILAGAAAGIGYKTYQQIGEVKTKLAITTKDRDDTKTTLHHTQDTLKDTTDKLTATTTQLETANETIKTTQAELTQATTDRDAAKAQVATLTADLAKANETINILKGTNPQTPTTNEGVIQKKIDDLQHQLDEANLNVKTLTTKANDAEQRLADLKKQIEAKKAIIAKAGVEGMVMAVNQGWSFVVISLGDRQGAVPNAELLVKRGETLIGKLKITTVNPSTSIADILQDSISKGQRILPGDRVIFTGPPTPGNP